MNIIDIIQAKFREFSNPSAHAETLISEALHPQEPIFWKTKPGKGLKPTTWLFLALSSVLLIGGILSILGFGVKINGSVDSAEGWQLIGGGLFFMIFALYGDRRDQAQSLYVITDRRLLVCAPYEDSSLQVYEVEIRSNTTVSYNQITKNMTIDTPLLSEGFRDSVRNLMRSSSVVLENIDNPDKISGLIQKIVERQSGTGPS